jgi:OOP family OmpA-OmpF porin
VVVVLSPLWGGTALAEEFPRFWVGLSGGGHLIATDLDLGEQDAFSRPVTADSSLYGELRLALDLSPRWALELGAGYLPFGASAETNDGLDLGLRARWHFVEVAVQPYLVVGAGTYVNFQPDPDEPPAFVPQGHYGLGIGPRLAEWARLRVEVRHQLSDGLDDAIGHALVGLVGVDLRLPEDSAPPPPEAPPPEAPPTEAPPPPPEVKPEVKPEVVVTCEQIEFTDLVFFETAEHALRSEAAAVLDAIARTLAERPDVRSVKITGFADIRGTAEFNKRLSKRRAQAVRDALVARGIDGSRLVAEGLGTASPRASNDTEEGRAQNRRVELTILQMDASATCPPKGNP